MHRLTGACPSLALHVLWDLPGGIGDVARVQALEQQHGVRAGAITPNLFQDQRYKHGSVGNPDPAVRAEALAHLRESVDIAERVDAIYDQALGLDVLAEVTGEADYRARAADQLEQLDVVAAPSTGV